MRPDPPPLDQLDAWLEAPASWPGLEPGLLRHLLFYACLTYGIDPDDERVPRVTALARLAVARLEPSARREVVIELARAVERLHRDHDIRDGAGYTNGLLPLLVEEREPSVVAAAACEMAILLPLEHGDPMSGPRYVASLVDAIDCDDSRAGIVGGLLSLGDARVGPLVAGAWRRLGLDGRQSLALLVQATHGLAVATMTFLLDWLDEEAEDPDSPSFGIVAATVGRAGLHAADHGLAEVVRAFPVTAAPEGLPFRVTRTWTRGQFIAVIGPRLDRLAARGHSDLVAGMRRCWGLEPESGRP
jgi:hypothetical protein